MFCALLVCAVTSASSRGSADDKKPPSSRATTAVASSNSGFVILAALERALSQTQMQFMALGPLIDQQTRFRDRMLALANQPYTACPHHHTFPTCTHTFLKAQYVRQCQIYRMAARRAQAILTELQIRRSVLAGQVIDLWFETLQASASLGYGG
jgi:hypothetical protein